MNRAIGLLVIIFIALSLFIFAISCSTDGGGAGKSDDDTDDDTDDDVNSFLDPENPGPYLVGNTSFIFEDTTRLLSCGEGNRRLVVEVWYPASDDASEWPENYFSDFFLNQLDAVIEYMKEHGELPPDGEFNDFPTGSYRDAPLNPDAAPMPILIFSHGISSNRFQNYTMSNYLASHGYLVVAPDHTCNAMFAPLPEGPIFFDPLNLPLTLGERKQDLSFLLDVFASNPPEMFIGRLDTQHIGFWGHSLGGITVTEQTKFEPRVSAMLQLAAFGFPPMPEGVTAQSMYMWGLQDKIMAPFETFHDQIIEQMPKPKYELNFIDTGHFAFSDLCVYAYDLAQSGDGCGSGTRIETGEPFENPGHDEMHKVMNPYATAFFGSAFFNYPELNEFLAQNHFPDRITYNPMTK